MPICRAGRFRPKRLYRRKAQNKRRVGARGRPPDCCFDSTRNGLRSRRQHHLIDDVELFRGTLTQTAVYPREIVKLTLARNAAAVILAHNHPSGVAEPSRADEQLTHTLKAALALVDVKVLDHFIVAGNAPPVSFAERGLL